MTSESPRVAVGFTQYAPTSVGNLGSVSAGGNVTAIAGNDINLVAAQINAGKDLALTHDSRS